MHLLETKTAALHLLSDLSSLLPEGGSMLRKRFPRCKPASFLGLRAEVLVLCELEPKFYEC
jgi:hypothetical protein